MESMVTVVLALAYSRLDGAERVIKDYEQYVNSQYVTAWAFQTGLTAAGESRLVHHMSVCAARIVSASNRSMCSVLPELVRISIIQIEEQPRRIHEPRTALSRLEVKIASNVVASETKYLIHKQRILTTN